MDDDGKFRVPFSFPEDGEIPPFSDCLIYTPDEWETVTDEEMAAEKQRRYTNFRNMIENPVPLSLPEEG